MFGQKIAVASAEFRVPLFGVEEFGLINMPFLPTELVLFADGGLAWDNNLTDINGARGVTDPVLKFSRSASEHVPVLQHGGERPS
jgi:outer membrane protein assembly factor BamA